jgi:hypothetical protein
MGCNARVVLQAAKGTPARRPPAGPARLRGNDAGDDGGETGMDSDDVSVCTEDTEMMSDADCVKVTRSQPTV